LAGFRACEGGVERCVGLVRVLHGHFRLQWTMRLVQDGVGGWGGAAVSD